MLTEMWATSCESKDRTNGGVAAAGMANDFIFGPILLTSEKGGEGSAQKNGGVGRSRGESGGADPEGKVAEAERVGVGSGRGSSMFARSEKKEKPNHGQIRSSLIEWRDGIGNGVGDQRKRDGLDASGRGVGSGVAFELLLQKIMYVALGI